MGGRLRVAKYGPPTLYKKEAGRLRPLRVRYGLEVGVLRIRGDADGVDLVLDTKDDEIVLVEDVNVVDAKEAAKYLLSEGQLKIFDARQEPRKPVQLRHGVVRRRR